VLLHEELRDLASDVCLTPNTESEVDGKSLIPLFRSLASVESQLFPDAGF
jgi:hypothetical protein